MASDAGRGLTIRMLTVCPTCRAGWPQSGEPRCAEPGEHEHMPYEAHLHRTPVRLPGGSVVWAVSFDAADPYGRADRSPDYGLYLDDAWSPPWAHEKVDWPDFGVPSDVDGLRDLLAAVRERAAAGDVVEIGCLGAHGRTGTALACLAILDGHAPEDAVAWVRANHCDHAVETPGQEAFVQAFRPA